jgi:hypothetical protein
MLSSMSSAALLLFARDSLDDMLRGRERSMASTISGLSGDSVLSTPVQDLVGAVLANCEVKCPELQLDRKYSPGAKDTRIDITGDYRRFTRGPGPHHIQGTEFAIHIPFEGEEEIFYLRPQAVSMNPPRAEIWGKELILKTSAPADSLDKDMIKGALDAQQREIEQHLERSRAQIAQFNSTLPGRAEGLIAARRAKVLKDRELEEFIGVPVGARPDRTPILAVDVPRRSDERAISVRTQEPFKPEPAISGGDYGAIVRAISSFGAAAERFPLTFSPMHEPVLREILLVILNNQFGSGVGEMFSRKGKTDIAVLHGDGPVFIAECKIWNGPSEFEAAISQLLSYLVWRDTKAAIVLFVRNRGVTEVVEKAKKCLSDHALNKRHGDPIDHCPVFVLHHPDDKVREINVALIIVPLPTSRESEGSS